MERLGTSIPNRMIRAAALDPEVYEELERDTGATVQALVAVTIIALIAGLGAFLAELQQRTLTASITGFVVGIAGTIIGWAIWSLVTYVVGTTLFDGTADWGELLRTIGFAYTPNVLQFFIFVPYVGSTIAFIGALWALVAGVVAVRQALDFSTIRAIFTVVIGWIIMLIVAIFLAAASAGS